MNLNVGDFNYISNNDILVTKELDSYLSPLSGFNFKKDDYVNNRYYSKSKLDVVITRNNLREVVEFFIFKVLF